MMNLWRQHKGAWFLSHCVTHGRMQETAKRPAFARAFSATFVPIYYTPFTIQPLKSTNILQKPRRNWIDYYRNANLPQDNCSLPPIKNITRPVDNRGLNGIQCERGINVTMKAKRQRGFTACFKCAVASAGATMQSVIVPIPRTSRTEIKPGV